MAHDVQMDVSVIFCNFQWFLFSIMSVTVLYLEGWGRFFRDIVYIAKRVDNAEVERSRTQGFACLPISNVHSSYYYFLN